VTNILRTQNTGIKWWAKSRLYITNYISSNISGINTKSNELVCHLLRDLSQILFLTEHHLTNLGIQTLNIDNYWCWNSCGPEDNNRLGPYYCRQHILKVGACMFIHRSHNFSIINLDSYLLAQDIEICAIQLHMLFRKLLFWLSADHHVGNLRIL